MTPIDLLAGALLGGSVVFAVIRALTAVATADAIAKRMAEVSGGQENHRQRLMALEAASFEDRQLLNKLAQLQGIKREKANG